MLAIKAAGGLHYRMRTAGSREVGLGVVLALQAVIMFFLAPLASMQILSPLILDCFRMALAAAAVMLLAPHRIVSAAITITFLASVLLSITFQSSSTAVNAEFMPPPSPR